MNKICVMCNTSPIIGLLSIGRLPLLWELFERVLIPEAVYRELCVDSASHQDDIEAIRRSVQEGKLSLYKVKNQEMVTTMYGKLHYGELEVIIGAKECGIKLAVMDDLAARKFASKVMLDTIGILGLLLLAKKEGLMDKITPSLDQLRNNGYYLSERLYQEVLKKANEFD